jgi:hypothetical protein
MATLVAIFVYKSLQGALNALPEPLIDGQLGGNKVGSEEELIFLPTTNDVHGQAGRSIVGNQELGCQ